MSVHAAAGLDPVDEQFWSGSVPGTYIGVSVLSAAVALAAGYLPARRAMRIAPTVAIRCD